MKLSGDNFIEIEPGTAFIRLFRRKKNRHVIRYRLQFSEPAKSDKKGSVKGAKEDKTGVRRIRGGNENLLIRITRKIRIYYERNC